MTESPRKKLAVWKLASCDGCQLSILDLEDELLLLSEAIEIAYFLEATRHADPGPYDISLIEGSVSTEEDIKKALAIREKSKFVIAIGACANSGGIQALRNYASHESFLNIVYASPQYISSLETSTAVSEHIHVDYELQGCPINKVQLVEVLSAYLNNRNPSISHSSVCMECKYKGNPCIMVSHGIPCLGPVTHAGCGALCPGFNRGCYGCYGPHESASPEALVPGLKKLGMSNSEMVAAFRSYQADNDVFKSASLDCEQQEEKKENHRTPPGKS